MDSIMMSKNLLSRIDEKNKIVFLKRDAESDTHRNVLRNLLESSNYFQLCVWSGTEVVFLNLHAVLSLSPFVARLVDELRNCCLTPHDQVHICLDQFPPHLINLVKNLLEKGECTVQSNDEEKQLEALIHAIGMDSSLQLYRRVHTEKPRSRKRKSSGGENLAEFKLRHCFDCSQPFSAGQSHICVISLDEDVEYGRDRLDRAMEDGQDEPEKDMEVGQDGRDRNVEDGQGKHGKAVKATGLDWEAKVRKDGIKSNIDEKQKINESEDMICPQCGKVYTKSPFYFQKHVQNCVKRNSSRGGNVGMDKNKNKIRKVDSWAEMLHKDNKKKTSTSHGPRHEKFVTKLDLSQEDPKTEKESKDCPSCGKRYTMNGRGAKRALAMYEIHVKKCEGGEYDTSSVDPDDQESRTVPMKDNECKKCGKIFKSNAPSWCFERHIQKCGNIEIRRECGKCGQNCNDGCNECAKCGKVFKATAPIHHFQKHIHYCKGGQEEKGRKVTDSKSASDIMQCEDCKSIFVGYEAFNNHQRNCLEGEKKHLCPNRCGKEFNDKKLLKQHSWNWNCSALNLSEGQNMVCQLCGEGEFNEEELYVHLYIRHDELRNKIKKEVCASISKFYFLERENLNCVCPLCGEEMKASRHSFGRHWAVHHKRMRKIYLSCSQNGQKEPESGDMGSIELEESIEIEDYEEDVSNDQEPIKTRETDNLSEEEKQNFGQEETLFVENLTAQDMNGNSSQIISNRPQNEMNSVWEMEKFKKQSSKSKKFGIEENNSISKKLPDAVENESPPNGIENDTFQKESQMSQKSKIEEKDSISEQSQNSSQIESPLQNVIGNVHNEFELEANMEKLPTNSQLETPSQMITGNAKGTENKQKSPSQKITNSAPGTDNETIRKQSVMSQESRNKEKRSISDEMFNSVDGTIRIVDENECSGIRKKLFSESESD